MVQSQGSLTIGTLAAAGDVGVETVRFYQRKGLLRTPPRDGGMRRYDAEDLRRLHFIKRAQAAGFTLGEIKELLTLDASGDRRRVRAIAKARIASLEAKIEELRKARDALDRLESACARGTKGPCPILRSFDV